MPPSRARFMTPSSSRPYPAVPAARMTGFWKRDPEKRLVPPRRTSGLRLHARPGRGRAPGVWGRGAESGGGASTRPSRAGGSRGARCSRVVASRRRGRERARASPQAARMPHLRGPAAPAKYGARFVAGADLEVSPVICRSASHAFPAYGDSGHPAECSRTSTPRAPAHAAGRGHAPPRGSAQVTLWRTGRGRIDQLR